MKFEAFDKDSGQTKVYAVEISREEIESVTWNSADQKFFERCSRGTVSQQLLGISILAKRIEEQFQLDLDLSWKSKKPTWKKTT
jgi:hypothetical protein